MFVPFQALCHIEPFRNKLLRECSPAGGGHRCEGPQCVTCPLASMFRQMSDSSGGTGAVASGVLRAALGEAFRGTSLFQARDLAKSRL